MPSRKAITLSTLASILKEISEDVCVGGDYRSGSHDWKLHRRLSFHAGVCGIGPESITLKPEMANHNSRVTLCLGITTSMLSRMLIFGPMAPYCTRLSPSGARRGRRGRSEKGAGGSLLALLFVTLHIKRAKLQLQLCGLKVPRRSDKADYVNLCPPCVL
jgi:hypothetical protein